MRLNVVKHSLLSFISVISFKFPLASHTPKTFSERNSSTVTAFNWSATCLISSTVTAKYTDRKQIKITPKEKKKKEENE